LSVAPATTAIAPPYDAPTIATRFAPSLRSSSMPARTSAIAPALPRPPHSDSPRQRMSIASARIPRSAK
jgi:hypothetical protein